MNKHDVSKLRNLLPTHYLTELRERVRKTAGRDYSRTYIHMVMTGQRHNTIIVDTALAWAQELKINEKQRTDLIDRLSE